MERDPMANFARAVVLVVSVTLTIVAVGPVEPQTSPWEPGYFPKVRLIMQNTQMTHSYDLVQDTQVLVTFVAPDEKDDCSLETARLLNVGRQ